jgi:hypothetical protein
MLGAPGSLCVVRLGSYGIDIAAVATMASLVDVPTTRTRTGRCSTLGVVVVVVVVAVVAVLWFELEDIHESAAYRAKGAVGGADTTE